VGPAATAPAARALRPARERAARRAAAGRCRGRCRIADTTRQRASSPSSRRSRARRGEGERLREEILEAAERLLLATGDQDAVSIRAIADAVGVTPPSIYLHFADKNELIFAVCRRHFAALDRAMEEAAAGAAGDPIEGLRRRGVAYARFGVENPEHYRILFMGKSSYTPANFSDAEMQDTGAFLHLVEATQACIAAGALPPDDAVVVAIHLWTAVHGITSLMISKPNFPWPDLEQMVGRILHALMYGMLTEEYRARTDPRAIGER
jgi:AcrR family transcriptional regulator